MSIASFFADIPAINGSLLDIGVWGGGLLLAVIRPFVYLCQKRETCFDGYVFIGDVSNGASIVGFIIIAISLLWRDLIRLMIDQSFGTVFLAACTGIVFCGREIVKTYHKPIKSPPSNSASTL